MTLVVPNAGEEAFLNLILSQDYTLRLFTNSVTDADTLETSDFTEATFTGYEAKGLTGASWTITSGDPATATYAVQAFVANADQAPQTVHGYYVTHATTDELRWYEKFVDGGGSPAPLTVQYNGEAIRITPQFTLSDTTD